MYKITKKWYGPDNWRYMIWKKHLYIYWVLLDSCKTLKEAEEIMESDTFVKYINK